MATTLESNADIEQFHFNGEEVTIDNMLDGVDVVIHKINESKDPNLVVATIRSLVGMQKLSGIALSKFLWSIDQIWNNLGTNERLPDFLYATTGLQRIVIDRYIEIWRMFAEDYVPRDWRSRLLQKPMKSLTPVANAISQGFNISNESWEGIALSANEGEVREIIRAEKGQAPRKNSLTIYLNRENGSLEAWTGRGETFLVGYLNISDAETNESLQKAINRIVNSSGIVVR